MKNLNEFIIESLSSTIVNKIKKEFKEKFDNKVTIGSCKMCITKLLPITKGNGEKI